MISERLFSRSYSSFWRDLLPFSEAFVRGVNAQWDHLAPDAGDRDPIERAVINEGAVRLFRMLVERRRNIDKYAKLAIQEAAEWLNCPDLPPEPWMIAETRLMASRLLTRYGRERLVFAPSFPGCGLISTCEADFLHFRTLVEVKSGHRGFRSADFRQILTYLALNDCAYSFDIAQIELFNARLERVVALSVDDLCVQVAGDTATEILSRIGHFITDGVPSGT